MSALGEEIVSIIEGAGSLTVEQFMELALGHPELGYYMTRDPFGVEGDFTTSPEISQMFGELVGLWAAEVWTLMGSPNPVQLVELGPGRGTLMSDALRAARVSPQFRDAVEVTLVEMSPKLADVQHQALVGAGAPISWVSRLDEAPPGPMIVIGNEFIDALPVRQYVRSGGRWRERIVKLDSAGKLTFGVARDAEPFIQAQAEEGSILEINPSAHRLAHRLAARLSQQGGAALFLDYGHVITGVGDTLQAIMGHQSVDPLHEPGEADLTAHVDFSAFARSARAGGAAVHGPIDQGDFLRALGIDDRVAALTKRAPERAEEFEIARNRLAGKGEGGMGALFKAIAIANRDLPPLPGFEPP